GLHVLKHFHWTHPERRVTLSCDGHLPLVGHEEDITRRQGSGHHSIRHEPEEVDVFNSQLRFFLPPPDDVFFVSANDYKLCLRQKSSEVQQQSNSEALTNLTDGPECNLLRR